MTTVATCSRLAALPGLALPGRPAGAPPDRLLSPGRLLLAGAEPSRALSLEEHRRRWPAPAHRSADELAELARATGLRGHGGAGFPTAVKLRAMRQPAGPVVVNASEGEDASSKDAVLLRHVPHLVLDGAVAAARALRSPRIVVRIAAGRTAVAAAVREAAAQRPAAEPRIEVSVGPDTLVAGEASAVVNALAGGPALPAPLGRPPKLRSGWGRARHVLLSNVETFARLAAALAGEYAASTLVTISGAVEHAGVLEVAPDTTVGDVLTTGRPIGRPRVLITGGWHGRWLPLDDRTLAAGVNWTGLAEVGGRLGAGVLIFLPEDVCAVTVAGAVADHLAAASAGQCGPCMAGLPELARAVHRADVLERIEAIAADAGRGLCAHPAQAGAAMVSAARLLAGEMAMHRAGHCSLDNLEGDS